MINLTPEDREKLVIDNMLLAYNYVHKHEIYLDGYEQEDLMQEALVGLVQAANTYDPNKKDKNGRTYKFSTYAVTCIRNHFGHLIEANSRKKRRGPDGNPVQIISLDAMNRYEDQI
jgi:RNA polymerase sigma factor (sigma-70 family)